MSRCPHCNKLTHPEDLCVYVDENDYDKIEELMADINWTSAYMYAKHDNPDEIGFLKKCDIKIRFILKKSEEIQNFK